MGQLMRVCRQLLQVICAEMELGLMSQSERDEALGDRTSWATTRMGHLCKVCRMQKRINRKLVRIEKCTTFVVGERYLNMKRRGTKTAYHLKRR
jgi:hypothetical protein